MINKQFAAAWGLLAVLAVSANGMAEAPAPEKVTSAPAPVAAPVVMPAPGVPMVMPTPPPGTPVYVRPTEGSDDACHACMKKCCKPHMDTKQVEKRTYSGHCEDHCMRFPPCDLFKKKHCDDCGPDHTCGCPCVRKYLYVHVRKEDHCVKRCHVEEVPKEVPCKKCCAPCSGGCCPAASHGGLLGPIISTPSSAAVAAPAPLPAAVPAPVAAPAAPAVKSY